MIALAAIEPPNIQYMNSFYLRICALLTLSLLLSFGFFSCEEEDFSPVGMETYETNTLLSDSKPLARLGSNPEDPIPEDCGCQVEVTNITAGTTMRLAAFNGPIANDTYLARECGTGITGSKVFDIVVSSTGTYSINNYGYSLIEYFFAARPTILGSGSNSIQFNVTCGNEATYSGSNSHTNISLGSNSLTTWSAVWPPSSQSRIYDCDAEPVCGDIVGGGI